MFLWLPVEKTKCQSANSHLWHLQFLLKVINLWLILFKSPLDLVPIFPGLSSKARYRPDAFNKRHTRGKPGHNNTKNTIRSFSNPITSVYIPNCISWPSPCECDNLEGIQHNNCNRSNNWLSYYTLSITIY